PPAADEVYAAGRAIPLSPTRGMRINFLGPPGGVEGTRGTLQGFPSQADRGGAFPVLSFVDVLNGRIEPARVRDRIVILGQTIRGVDEHSTPTTAHTRMWGVE